MICMKKLGGDNLRKIGSAEKTKSKSLIVRLLIMMCFALFSVGTIYAQELTVKGIVVDASGEPLIGASVKVVDGKEKAGNLSLGTVTNFDGEYSLNVSNRNFSLEFSYIGYTPVVIPASNASALARVVLQENANQLAEVVVTGMTQVDKRMFTGATDRLSAENIKLGGIADISRSLDGRSAGVSVQNVSGTFGSAPKIRVRGATSIYGDSKPLWVVDGVIMQDVTEVSADDLSSGDINTLVSSAIAGLNADDIADIQILKDGSATSIYGAKAMAGVIVVTTKKGASNSASIRYSGEFTTRMIPSYSDINIMNSQEQMAVYQEMEQKGWLNYSDVYNAKNSGEYGRMYRLINSYDPATGSFALANTEAARNAFLRNAEYRNTDWFDELFSSVPSQNHSVSLSGGTEKSTYYASVSALLDPGWHPASSLKRYTANLNVDHKIYSNLTLSMKAKAYTRNQKAPGTMKRETNSVYGEVFRNFDINPYYYAIHTSRVLDPDAYYVRDYAPFNIKHELETNYMDLDEASTTISGELKWTPVKGLDVRLLGVYKYTGSTMDHNVMDNSNQAEAYRAMETSIIANNNPLTWRDPSKPYAQWISLLPQGGFYERTTNKMTGYDWRASANYATSINTDHVITLFGGMEFNTVDRFENWNRQWGRQYDKGQEPFWIYEYYRYLQQRGENTFSVKNRHYRDESFFGQASYSYAGKYLLSLTGRYEGSNKMGKSRKARWLPTFDVSGRWNVSDEAFAQAWKPVISFVAIRPGYSLTATAPPTNYSTAVVFGADTKWRPNTTTNEPTILLTDPGNPNLTYEKKKEFNLGLELGFIDNRISLALDAYKRHNYSLIGKSIAAGYDGSGTTKDGNVAEMDGQGIEATLVTKNINGKDFKWTTNIIFSKFKTEITTLLTNQRIVDMITGNGFAREGYSHRMLFSIPFAGLGEDGIPLVYDANGNKTKYIYFQDRSNTDFLIPEGPTEPTLTGGLGNTFRYKNLSLNVFFTYSFGNKLRLDPFFSASYSDLDAMPKEFKNRWILPGDENYTNVPVLLSHRQYRTDNNNRYAYSAYNYSTERVADGGFVRLKDITLAYDFPSRIIAPIGFKALALKVQATNMALLYADKKLNGQDPEFYNTGGVASPVPRQITFTVSLGL